MSILQKKGSNRRTPYTKTCGSYDKVRLIKRYSPVQGVPPKKPPTKVWVYEMQEPICMTVRDNVIEAIDGLRAEVDYLKANARKQIIEREQEMSFRFRGIIADKVLQFESKMKSALNNDEFRGEIIKKLRWMNYKIHRVCPHCNGTRTIKNFQPCGFCNGQGCNSCDDTGMLYVRESMCLGCNGTGRNPNPEIDIRLDSNMDFDMTPFAGEPEPNTKRKPIQAITLDMEDE